MEKTNSKTGKTKLNKSMMLVIMPEGKERDTLFATVKRSNFQLLFCASTQEAFAILSKTKPGILIQDWESIDSGQATLFHQRLQKNEEYESLCRIILADTITEKLRAVGIDCGIRRILNKANASTNMLEEIKMALAAETSLTSLQKKVASMRLFPQTYNQEEIDEGVEEAYKKFSHDPVVKLEFGNLCTRRKEYEEAELLANYLLSQEPANVRAMNLLSRCMMKTGRFDDGVTLLENANILSPSNPERLISLGEAFLKKGDKTKAKEYLVEALEIDPQNKLAAENLGDIALAEGDATSIVDMFQNSLSEEEIVGFFNNAAVSKVRNNNYDDALSLYEMAMSASLTAHIKCMVQFNIGLALRRMHDLPAALRAFKRCLRLDPDFKKVIQQIYEVEQELERKQKA